ncbi:MAG: zinc ribbon domain-containing protein [Deferribacteres bacterium]|nr:zinc ribbon domain-containing protein [candidate division KSB1 bacterium]MCB9511893.1 zinc ribbon domain-containing protein [Deferribacteres bacterium]
MPTYDYRCKTCGHQFEVFHSISAEPVQACPNCNGNGQVERLINGGIGLIFKGSGFYLTDYAKSNSSSATSTTSSDSTSDSPSKSDGEKSGGKKNKKSTDSSSS